MRRGKTKVHFGSEGGGDPPAPSALGIEFCVDTPFIRIVGDRTSFHWNASQCTRPEIAREFIIALKELADQAAVTQFTTLRGYRDALIAFTRHLDRIDPQHSVTRLPDVDRAVLDTYDPPEIQTAQWTKLSRLVKTLRFIRRRRPESVSEGLSDSLRGDRLRFISRHGKPKTTPKDPYSPYVAAQLKAAAERQIREARQRVRIGSEPAGSKGTQPEALSRLVREHFAKHGRLSAADYQTLRRSAGFQTFPHGSGVALSTEQLERAADLLVEGRGPLAVASIVGVPIHRINRAVRASVEFARLQSEKRRQYVAATCSLIRQREQIANPRAQWGCPKVLALEGYLLSRDERLLDQLRSFSRHGFQQWEDRRRGLFRTSRPGASDRLEVEWVERLLRCARYERILKAEDQADDCGSVLSVLADTLFPRPIDLVALLIAIGLRSKLDFTGLKALKRDCLRSPAGGEIDIFYIKSRAEHAKLKDRVADGTPAETYDRVRDGGYDTAGGLVRIALELTEFASAALSAAGHPHRDDLWLRLDRAGELRRLSFAAHCFKEFCKVHEIYGDDGSRLSNISPSRFRKTTKATTYTRANGDVRSLLDDHTFTVARDNYGDLPALADLHDQALTNGMRRALTDATPHVISSDVPIDQAAEYLRAKTGYSIDTCRKVLRGEEDVWLAGCLSFRGGAYSAPGQPCSAAFTACMRCDNAVFTARKIPNLLRYRAILLKHREVVSDAAWQNACALDLSILENLILPSFSADEIASAEGQVEEDAPLFLPAQWGAPPT